MSEQPATMRAWRVHEYGQPLDVLRLEDVAIPEPGPGEVLVRVQAIPLNLNDLERITGGNMMVRPEFPYSPGMEVMGVVDASAPVPSSSSAGGSRRSPSRLTAASPSTQSARASAAFEMPDDDRPSRRGSDLLPLPSRLAGPVRPRRTRAGETVLIHAAAGGSGTAAIQLAKHAGARVFASVGDDDQGRAVPCARRRRRDQLHGPRTSPRSCCGRPAGAASTSCSTTSAKRCSRGR